LRDVPSAFCQQEDGWSAPLGTEQQAKRKMDARAADLFINTLLRYCIIAFLLDAPFSALTEVCCSRTVKLMSISGRGAERRKAFAF
jgi:hypothetical protein